MKALDDGTLLDRWRETRDGDAFAEIAQRHSPVVFDLTCRVLGDRAAAEDVLQEALLSLALEPTRKPVEVGVVAWLARFAICRARNRRSSERARARRQLVAGRRRPEESMPDDALERTDELEHALAECEPEDRALLAMRFLHGWEYDRIAAALTISEGAARVRVHRALEAVRRRSRERDASRISRVLAAVPLATLPTARLEAAISSAVEIAKVRLGAPPNGVEQATAASSAFRVAVALTGTAMLFVAAAGAATVVPVGAPAPVEVAEVRVAVPEIARFPGFVPAGQVAGGRGETGVLRFPRPADWDRALDPGVTWIDGAPERRQAAAPERAAAAPAPAPAAPPPAADPFPAVVVDEPPNASRPTSRGACAAKGDLVSSDGERAGAFGSSSDPAEPADEARAPAAPPLAIVAPPATRTVARAARPAPVEFDALPEGTRALVGEAEGLIRDVLARVDDGRRMRARDLRREFARLRRGAGPGSIPKTQAARAKRSAALRQVLSLLSHVVLSDGRVAGDLRWPSGADANAALAEVIRVLGTDPARSLPSGATGTLPAGAGIDGAE